MTLDCEEEVWMPVPGEDTKYQVSNLGRVRRLAYIYLREHYGKIIQVPIPLKILGGQTLSQKGYPRVNLNGHWGFIHKLVALAFIENPHKKPQVNHKNGIKTDNRASNLEWVTNQENRDHALRLNLQASRQNGNLGKISLANVEEIARLAAAGFLQREIGAKFGVGQQTISKILRNKNSMPARGGSNS